jgi:helix-turn-helix protein
LHAVSGGALQNPEAARFLGVGVRTLDNLLAQGRVSPIDNSIRPEEGKRGRVTFDKTELERYMRDNTVRV